MRHKISLLVVLALVIAAPAFAAPPHPARHGNTVVWMRVCEAPVTVKRHLANTDLLSIGGRVGSRRLRYWNESPSTSYLYGLNTFVRISESDHVLTFRAVRLVPVCAPLKITYSW